MDRVGRIRTAGLVAVALALVMGPAADAMVLQSHEFTRDRAERAYTATVGNLALNVGVGDIDLTLANGSGSLGFRAETVDRVAPSLPDELLVNCSHPRAIGVSGVGHCVSANKLSDRGVSVPGGSNPEIGVSPLVDAGVAQLVPTGSTVSMASKSADTTMVGLLVPNIARSEAACTLDNPKAEQVNVPVPAAVAPVIDGNLSYVRCRSELVDGTFPALHHETGEAVLDVTLTETLVADVGAVNGAIDTLQSTIQPLPSTVRDPVDTALEQLQQRLNAQPVVKVRVAPTSGDVTAAARGATATSIARGVTIDILPLADLPIGGLDGVAQITIGQAKATGSIDGESASAANDVAILRVKVLNLLTPDPDDVLVDQTVNVPDTNLTILENTPLQTTIKASHKPEPVQACNSEAFADGAKRVDCQAKAQADALSISIFDPVLANGTANPLPNVRLKLASAGVEVLGSANQSPNLVRLPLARTGASATGSLFAGLAVTAGAIGLRRRLAR